MPTSTNFAILLLPWGTSHFDIFWATSYCRGLSDNIDFHQRLKHYLKHRPCWEADPVNQYQIQLTTAVASNL